MLLDHRPLVGRERTALREDRGWDRDLPDGVEERCVAEIAKLILAETETLAEGDRVRGDAALMILAVLIARFDRRGQRADRREVRVLELAVQLQPTDLPGTDARDDAEQLALLRRDRVDLAPGHEEHAHELI